MWKASFGDGRRAMRSAHYARLPSPRHRPQAPAAAKSSRETSCEVGLQFRCQCEAAPSRSSQIGAQWHREVGSIHGPGQGRHRRLRGGPRRYHTPAPAHWRLHGGLTTLLYDTPGLGVLHYIHPPMNLVFNGPQIRVVANPDLGTLVGLSVSPVAETTFTVLLPAVVVDAAHPVEPVQTEGITTNH